MQQQVTVQRGRLAWHASTRFARNGKTSDPALLSTLEISATPVITRTCCRSAKLAVSGDGSVTASLEFAAKLSHVTDSVIPFVWLVILAQRVTAGTQDNSSITLLIPTSNLDRSLLDGSHKTTVSAPCIDVGPLLSRHARMLQETTQCDVVDVILTLSVSMFIPSTDIVRHTRQFLRQALTERQAAIAYMRNKALITAWEAPCGGVSDLPSTTPTVSINAEDVLSKASKRAVFEVQRCDARKRQRSDADDPKEVSSLHQDGDRITSMSEIAAHIATFELTEVTLERHH